MKITEFQLVKFIIIIPTILTFIIALILFYMNIKEAYFLSPIEAEYQRCRDAIDEEKGHELFQQKAGLMFFEQDMKDAYFCDPKENIRPFVSARGNTFSKRTNDYMRSNEHATRFYGDYTGSLDKFLSSMVKDGFNINTQIVVPFTDEFMNVLPYAKDEITCRDKRHDSLLHMIASFRCPECFKLMVEKYSADPSIRNCAGANPFHIAALRGHYWTIRWAVENGHLELLKVQIGNKGDGATVYDYMRQTRDVYPIAENQPKKEDLDRFGNIFIYHDDSAKWMRKYLTAHGVMSGKRIYNIKYCLGTLPKRHQKLTRYPTQNQKDKGLYECKLSYNDLYLDCKEYGINCEIMREVLGKIKKVFPRYEEEFNVEPRYWF